MSVEERFGLSWIGKQETIEQYNSYDSSNYELIENKERSIDSDNTNNIIIEGDNLPVLSLLQEQYKGKVKMIYIDPPYNTGRKMAYNDKFWSGREYKHSKWLSMMYPRLKLARELLRDDGVIFVSIDEKSDAYKAGYKKISDITIERIKRAGSKIKEELDNTDIDIDLGFKVLELKETISAGSTT